MDQRLDIDDPHAHARFDGRVAVITGGTQGLGYATADLMAARGAAGLVLAARSADKGAAAVASLTQRHPATKVVFHQGDLAADGAVDALMATVDAEFDAIHALVNCAAATWRGTVWNTTEAMWDAMLTLNVRLPGLLVSACATRMKDAGVDGSMVLISSVAHHGGAAILYPYATSKHAVEALVRNAAFSLMPERIRVNMLNPGWMDTPAEHDVQQRFHGAPDDWLVAAEQAQPFGRLLKPQEVARAICFLASPESGMMTGASVDFDQTIPGVGDLPRAAPVPEHFDWQD